MKGRRMFLFLSALILTAAVAFSARQESTVITTEHFEPVDEISVMVATDLHYLAPELTDHGPYFQKVIQGADGKMTHYAEEILDAFVQQTILKAPDALILSGDLTFNGEAISHQILAEKLQSVKDAGISVLVLPGNHDLDNPMAAQFEGNGFRMTESVTAEEFEKIYGALRDQEVLEKDESSLSYVAELSHNLRVLLVDVNTAEAPGAIKNSTLAWVEEQLQEAADAGAWVIAVSHQNLLQHNSLFTEGYRMENAQQLLALYERYPVICNISGHIHLQHIAESKNELREIVTSSLAVNPNQYGVLHLDGWAAHYQTMPLEIPSQKAGSNAEEQHLMEFASTSRQFFWDTGYRQALAELGNADGAHKLATFFADVNTAYFSGRMDTCRWDADLFRAWQTKQTFLSHYLNSIADDGFRDHTTVSFDFGGMIS